MGLRDDGGRFKLRLGSLSDGNVFGSVEVGPRTFARVYIATYRAGSAASLISESS